MDKMGIFTFATYIVRRLKGSLVIGKIVLLTRYSVKPYAATLGGKLFNFWT